MVPAANADLALTARLADAFYTEAMLLADETRSYLDGPGLIDRADLSPRARVAFACESLNGTTRLMQAVAWLLARRAVRSGEIPAEREAHRLGNAPAADTATIEILPPEARRLLEAGIDLYERVRRLDEGIAMALPGASPARSLMERLERSF